MAASRIKVKALPGRVVRISPNGKFVPDDKFITVANTPYIQRLINHWGDLEDEAYDAAAVSAANAAALAAAKASSPVAAPAATTTATTATK